MRRISIVAVGLALLAFEEPAFAQHQGSLEDQMACTGDVYRLCASLIPNEDAITSCLDKNKPQLSPACRAVFSRPAPTKGKQPQQGDDSDD